MKTPITLEGKTVFVTGSAGFIGANLVKRLLTVKNIRIIGIDNMNDYYDVSLKEYRLQELEKEAALAEGSEYHFIRGNLADKDCITDIFSTWHPDRFYPFCCSFLLRSQYRTCLLFSFFHSPFVYLGIYRGLPLADSLD